MCDVDFGHGFWTPTRALPRGGVVGVAFAHKDANLGGGAVEVRTDTFGPEFEPGTAHLMTLVPVHGTAVQVILRNNGSQPAKAGVAWIYGVR